MNEQKRTGVTYRISKSPEHPDWDCLQIIRERDGRVVDHSPIVGRALDGNFYLLLDALPVTWTRVTDQKDVNTCREMFEARDEAAARNRVKTAVGKS